MKRNIIMDKLSEVERKKKMKRVALEKEGRLYVSCEAPLTASISADEQNRIAYHLMQSACFHQYMLELLEIL